jgi:hypothetical protein
LTVPTAGEIVEQLRKVTGVSLSIGASANEDKPAFGSVSWRNVPAHSVMDQLAKSKWVQGHWERAGDGYRLIPAVQPPPESSSWWESLNPLAISAAGLALVLVLLGGLWYCRRRLKAAKPVPSRQHEAQMAR